MGAGLHGISVQFTHGSWKLGAFPLGLIPPHPFYPLRLIIEHFWMSRYIRLDTFDNLLFTLVKYHGLEKYKNPPWTDAAPARGSCVMNPYSSIWA